LQFYKDPSSFFCCTVHHPKIPTQQLSLQKLNWDLIYNEKKNKILEKETERERNGNKIEMSTEGKAYAL